MGRFAGVLLHFVLKKLGFQFQKLVFLLCRVLLYVVIITGSPFSEVRVVWYPMFDNMFKTI